ncbi:unnamed protein product [Urochloa humidicola]
MDAASLNKKPPPATAADGALPSAAHQAVEPSSPPGDAAAAGAGMRRTSGGEDDDEQVERFYALLENIRAVRGMLGTATGGGAATTAGRKRRAREAEPPWRPAFRMEDFEVEEVQSDAAPPPCSDGSKRNRWEGSCGARRRETAAADGEEEKEKDGEVVEAKGPRRAQLKARRAGVLAVDGPGSR